MVLDINMLRQNDRDGGGVATSETVCSEGQQGFRQVSNELMKMLNFAWSQCVVMKDYEKALIDEFQRRGIDTSTFYDVKAISFVRPIRYDIANNRLATIG